MKKYSKQREAIKAYLKTVESHPSAAEIYNEVRKTIPNISLGTVYRNLADLQDSGEIVNVSANKEMDRFDGDLSPHIHLCCRKCNSITDVPVDSDYGKKIATGMGFTPDSSVYIVYGICKNCAGK